LARNNSSVGLLDRAKTVGNWLAGGVSVGIVALGVKLYMDNAPTDTILVDNASLSEPFNNQAPSPPSADAAEIDAVISGILEPSDTLPTETSPVQIEEITGLSIDTDGIVSYTDGTQTWTVPAEVFEAETFAAQVTPLPLSFIMAVHAVESSFNPIATNDMGTCGLSQFVPSTLSEMAYKYSGLIGYDNVRDNLVIRTRDEIEGENGEQLFQLDYHFNGDEIGLEAMNTLCEDPNYNTMLSSIMKIRDIGRMQINLSDLAPEGADFYPITELHGYLAVFGGRGAAQNMIRDLHENDGVTNALNFFSDDAAANATNQRLLYHSIEVKQEDGSITVEPDTSNPRTVAEFMVFLENDRGLSNDMVFDDLRDWGTISTQIAQNLEHSGMERIDVATLKIISPLAPERSLRPELRPEHLAFNAN